jgi:hypothetical protein
MRGQGTVSLLGACLLALAVGVPRSAAALQLHRRLAAVDSATEQYLQLAQPDGGAQQEGPLLTDGSPARAANGGGFAPAAAANGGSGGAAAAPALEDLELAAVPAAETAALVAVPAIEAAVPAPEPEEPSEQAQQANKKEEDLGDKVGAAAKGLSARTVPPLPPAHIALCCCSH